MMCGLFSTLWRKSVESFSKFCERKNGRLRTGVEQNSTKGDKQDFAPQCQEHRTSKKTEFLWAGKMQLRSWILKEWKLTFPLQNLVERNGSKNTKNIHFLGRLGGTQFPESRESEEKSGLSSLFWMQFCCETRLTLPCFSKGENCCPDPSN